MNLLMSIAFGSFKHGNCAYCIVLNLLIFFWVDLGQPIWPVTPSLDRIDDQVEFQNYDIK